MDRELNGWDIFFIVLSGILLICLLLTIILPLTRGLNPFKLMVGNLSDYNFSESSEYRNSNILSGLLGQVDPNVYPLNNKQDEEFDFSENDKPIFKHFDGYNLLIESYNEPKFSSDGIEIYGPYGVEFSILPTEDVEGCSIAVNYYEGLTNSKLIPYYSYKLDGVTYVSAIDLYESVISLEKIDEGRQTTVASISGATWKAILEKNGGVAVLRKPDGTLLFDGGEYILTLSFKQIMLSIKDGNVECRIVNPKNELYHLKINEHECSNGVIIANDATLNMDIQLNIVNAEKTVCYAPQSKINVGNSLIIGVSLSEDRFRNLLGDMLSKTNLAMFIEIHKYDNKTNDFVLLENRKVMDPLSVFLNNTFVFEGESYQSGRYKIVMRYGSWLERIEQEYEYYLVFEQ